MAKLSFALIALMIIMISSRGHISKAAHNETVTTLQFYFHDKVSGRNPTATIVAQAEQTQNSTTGFGMVVMVDNRLTETPDPNSKLVGRAQGLYGSAGQSEISLIMAMSFGFTQGEYNGSSISIVGRNSAMERVREMPVVGGTGVFRLARGYALAQTQWFNVSSGDAIVGYNVTIVQ